MNAAAKPAGTNCLKDETINLAPAKFRYVPEGLQPILNPGQTGNQFFEQLCSDFNTRSPELAKYAVRLLSSCLKGKNDDELNALIALIAESHPRDGVETLLLCQMVLTNRRALQALSDMASTHLPESQGQYASMAASLLRLFTRQMKALRKYRNSGTQHINVYHVNANQAVVGLNTGGTQ